MQGTIDLLARYNTPIIYERGFTEVQTNKVRIGLCF